MSPKLPSGPAGLPTVYTPVLWTLPEHPTGSGFPPTDKGWESETLGKILLKNLERSLTGWTYFSHEKDWTKTNCTKGDSLTILNFDKHIQL